MTLKKDSGVDRRSGSALRALLASGIATVFVAGLAGSASAYEMFGNPIATTARPAQPTRVSFKRKRSRANRWQAADPTGTKGPEKLQGPLTLVVAIKQQHVTLYANGEQVGRAPVSTGMAGHPTPMGVFSVIEKDRYHHSNIYSGAPMPYMQRITWSGVALHQGVLPGFPASHGCIRMPQDFAIRLWSVTQVGVRVIVTPDDVAPVAIANDHLFAMKPKLALPPVAVLDPVPTAKIRLATNAEVTDTPTLPAVESAVAAPAVTAPAAAEPAAVAPAAAEPATTESTAATPSATEPAAPVPTAATPTGSDPATTDSAAAKPSTTEPTAKEAGATEAAKVDDAIEQGRAVTEAIRATQAKEAAARAEEIEAAQAADRAVERAAAKPADLEKSKLVATAKQYPERPGPITVFISRSLGKLMVRRGFWPVFETPVKIAAPDRPLGTHVFTALEPQGDKGALRWNVVSMPAPTSAPAQHLTRAQRRLAAAQPQQAARPIGNPSDALGRITIPDEALDRISELVTPGASLIISDLGISPETNRGTDFIVQIR